MNGMGRIVVYKKKLYNRKSKEMVKYVIKNWVSSEKY